MWCELGWFLLGRSHMLLSIAQKITHYIMLIVAMHVSKNLFTELTALLVFIHTLYLPVS